MRHEHLETKSWSVAPFWKCERTEPLTTLTSNQKCDVLVIGAGVTGLSVAHSLCQDRKVVVVDAGRIGEGSTGWAAGILSQATTIDFSIIEKLLGEEQARSLSFFLNDAIVKARSAAVWNDGEWQTGSSLYFAEKRAHKKLLTEEYNLRNKYGLATEYLEGPHLKFWKNFPVCLEMPGEHAVHPVKLLLGLVASIRKAGGKVFEQTSVVGWAKEADEFSVKCVNNEIRAQHIVVCTGSQTVHWSEFRDLVRFNVPATSHVLVTEPSDEFAEFVKNTGRIAAWNSLHLYNYIRYLRDGRVLIGGEDSPGTCQNAAVNPDERAIVRLHRWAQRHHAKSLPPVEFAWKAGLTIPADGLPAFKLKLLGDNMLIAAITDGLPFAFVLGSVIAQLIQSGEHPLSRLLSYRRPVPAPVRMLSMIPRGPVRDAAIAAAFAGMRLRDVLL